MFTSVVINNLDFIDTIFTLLKIDAPLALNPKTMLSSAQLSMLGYGLPMICENLTEPRSCLGSMKESYERESQVMQ